MWLCSPREFHLSHNYIYQATKDSLKDNDKGKKLQNNTLVAGAQITAMGRLSKIWV